MTLLNSSIQAQRLAEVGRLKDFVWQHILPYMCLLGIFANFLNILVFLSPKLKDSTFKLMMANSFVEIAFLVISGLGISIFCGTPCLSNYFTYLGQILSIWFVNYIGRSMAVLSTLIEIFISFQRLMLIKNIRFLKDVSVIKVLVVLTIISLIYYLPAFFSAKIGQSLYPLVFFPNSTQIDFSRSKLVYVSVFTDFGNSHLGKILLATITIVRMFFATFVLLLINILSALEFKERIKKKLRMGQTANISSKS